MQLVLHAGAHFTEEERLLKCLLSNREAFSKRGVAVPGPGKYRDLIRHTLHALKTAPLAEGARDVMLDATLDEEDAERMILSNAHFFGFAMSAVRGGVLYPTSAVKLQQFCSLFPNDQIELFFAIKNPATFLPAIYQKSKAPDLQSFLGVPDPCDIRWSDMLMALRAACPNVAITVWCSEDAPLIWAQIVREMAGLEHGEKIIGGFDLLREIMSPEGMKRFRAYLKPHPVMTEMQKRRVIAAFLDKFAIEDQIEEELDMPGWTTEMVDNLSDAYDEDVFAIQRIPGVSVIIP